MGDPARMLAEVCPECGRIHDDAVPAARCGTFRDTADSEADTAPASYAVDSAQHEHTPRPAGQDPRAGD